MNATPPAVVQLSPLVLPDGAALRQSDQYLSVPRRVRRSVSQTHWSLVEHVVASGESLWTIAGLFTTDLATLIALNPDIDPQNLQPGQKVVAVQNFRGVAVRTRPGDSATSLASAYGITAESIVAANAISDADPPPVGTLLFLPGAKPRVAIVSRGAHTRRAVAVATPRPSAPIPRGSWVWPLENGLLFSEFGQREDGFHSGLDIAVPTGTPAKAVASGTVVLAGWDGGYGYSVILDHGNGVQTRYAHAHRVLVAVGQHVEQGAPIIEVGSSGNSTGPHLHLEFIAGGQPDDPRLYLPPLH